MFLLIVALAVVSYVPYWFLRRQQRQRELALIVDKRRHEREASKKLVLKSASLLASSRRDVITSWSFQQLKDELQSGGVSCVDVLRAYQWKAIEAHEATNCVAMFIKEAEQWALDWDRKAEAKNFVKPPFFGIPISLKECVPKLLPRKDGFIEFWNCFPGQCATWFNYAGLRVVTNLLKEDGQD
ncbi:unnamed protein product [Nippostrongylus brasiliensis]|uniref:Fatty-acid amide hydrolase 1 (inferred by orthology to a human protein) n=1 Tax=Nippostrongylus brasiliensis TaxID=27835 RepID=A0A158R2W9_NIPBR|nr:unnamed protein product [Nippostrongylus brasiliensis]